MVMVLEGSGVEVGAVVVIGERDGGDGVGMRGWGGGGGGGGGCGDW